MCPNRALDAGNSGPGVVSELGESTRKCMHVSQVSGPVQRQSTTQFDCGDVGEVGDEVLKLSSNGRVQSCALARGLKYGLVSETNADPFQREPPITEVSKHVSQPRLSNATARCRVWR